MSLTKVPTNMMGSGAVLQVVSVATTTRTATTSASYVDSGLSLSFTPSSATSKILIISDPACNIVPEPGGMACRFYDATSASQLGYEYMCLRIDYSGGSGTIYMYNRASMTYSMASWGTSAKTISVQFRSTEGGQATFNEVYPTTQQSTLTLIEIAG